MRSTALDAGKIKAKKQALGSHNGKTNTVTLLKMYIKILQVYIIMSKQKMYTLSRWIKVKTSEKWAGEKKSPLFGKTKTNQSSVKADHSSQ